MNERSTQRVRRRVLAVIEPSLEPGEELRTVVYGIQRPRFLFGFEVILSGWFILFMRYYAVAVTNRRFFLITRSKLSGRPRTVRWVEPLEGVVIEASGGGVVTRLLAFRRRTDDRAIRLRIPIPMRAEAREVEAAVRGG